MAELRDPKLERFAKALYANLIVGMKRSEAADLAADVAGYKGSSRSSNARKRAQRADVKRRLIELAQPTTERERAQIDATKDWARQKLAGIADVELAGKDIKPSDQIAALRLLAEIEGWKAPEKRDVTVRDADKLTDDELAHIAGTGSENAADAPGHSPGP